MWSEADVARRGQLALLAARITTGSGGAGNVVAPGASQNLDCYVAVYGNPANQYLDIQELNYSGGGCASDFSIVVFST